MVLIAALLCARLAGTHWHLCFDGTEPKVALQLQAHDVYEDFGNDKLNHSKPKQDVDIDVFGQLMAKIAKASLGSAVFVASMILLLLLPPATAPLRSWLPEPLLPPDRPGIRPPLRAPPR